jgi:hypothetical protein
LCLTCQDSGIYIVLCKKSTGLCARLAPIYVGETGVGEEASFTHRFAQHLGTATQPGQADTVKPVGRHFRLPGHEAQRDMVMLPLELVRGGVFERKARERMYIERFDSEKRMSVFDIEHGMNLDQGQ